jgi:hypothetical protein
LTSKWVELLADNRIIHSTCKQGSDWKPEHEKWSVEETTSHAKEFNNLLTLYSKYHTVLSAIQEEVFKEILKKEQIEQVLTIANEIIHYKIPVSTRAFFASCKATDFSSERNQGKSYKDLYLEEIDKFKALEDSFQQLCKEVTEEQIPHIKTEQLKENRKRVRMFFTAGDPKPKSEASELAEKIQRLLDRNKKEDISYDLEDTTNAVNEKIIETYALFESIIPDDRCHEPTLQDSKESKSSTSASHESIRSIMNAKLRSRLRTLEEAVEDLEDDAIAAEEQIVELTQFLENARSVAESVQTMMLGIQYVDLEAREASDLLDQYANLSPKVSQSIAR